MILIDNHIHNNIIYNHDTDTELILIVDWWLIHNHIEIRKSG